MMEVEPMSQCITSKPEKPYPDFALFPHASGRWAKKVRGKLHYFGRWDRGVDPMVALQAWKDQEEDLRAGRVPRVKDKGLTLEQLSDRFLTTKRRLRDNGEIVPRSFLDYYQTCRRLVQFFGKSRLVSDLAADDFEQYRAALAKTRGLVALGTEIGRVRSIMKYAYDQGLIQSPVRYGQSFHKPSKRVLLKARYERGPRMFSPAEIRKMLDAANPTMKTMILLAVNCGFGPSDLARLPLTAIDLKGGWIDYPRPKTAVMRRCAIWRETREAIKNYLKTRQEPKDKAHQDRLFVTKHGRAFADEGGNAGVIGGEFLRLVERLGIHRNGLGLYTLRHVFETVGGDFRDQVAVDHIMGHVSPGMGSVYRESISDERLRAVVDHVRKWLFGTEEKK
jgi:integrase